VETDACRRSADVGTGWRRDAIVERKGKGSKEGKPLHEESRRIQTALQGKGGKVTREKKKRDRKIILRTALVPGKICNIHSKITRKIHNKNAIHKANEKNKINTNKRRTKV
jgi:hypothetical protein